MLLRNHSRKHLLRSFQTMMLLMAVLALQGCSSTYQMVEVWRPKDLERTLYHAYEDGPNIGLICRQLGPGKAEVGVRIMNDTSAPLAIPMDLKLYVNGDLLYSEKGPSIAIVDPGGTKDFSCSPVFRSFVTRTASKLDEKDGEQEIRLYKGSRVVYATIGPHRTPDVIIDLAPENQVPFRFSEEP
jgi:hypothetical protein